MSGIYLGQVSYLNCLPVYHVLEEGLLPLKAKLVKGTPSRLNNLFLKGKLHITPISSIEYARHPDKCLILPNLSISADGRVASILFFSKIPVTEMEGKRACLTSSSATAHTMLKILFEHYYHMDVEFFIASPDLKAMLSQFDGALLIGDDAMLAHQQVLKEGWPVVVTDLGEVWKQFTGEKMVYALWVIQKEYAKDHPAETERISQLLYQSRLVGFSDIPALVKKGRKRTGLPVPVLEDYFNTICYDFDEDYRRALLLFYDYAYKSGLIEERAKLFIWGEED